MVKYRLPTKTLALCSSDPTGFLESLTEAGTTIEAFWGFAKCFYFSLGVWTYFVYTMVLQIVVRFNQKNKSVFEKHFWHLNEWKYANYAICP